MHSVEVRFRGLPERARSAFERNLPFEDIVSYDLHQKSATTPIAIDLLLAIRVLEVLGIVAWGVGRINKYIDGFLGEAGKDSYLMLKEAMTGEKEEQTQLAASVNQISKAGDAVEELLGTRAPLAISISDVVPVEISIDSNPNLSEEEYVCAALLMMEPIAKSVDSLQLADPLYTRVQIKPYGFLLEWFDNDGIEMIQPFLPDGKPISEPSQKPAPTPEERHAHREALIALMPEERRDQARSILERNDRERQ